MQQADSPWRTLVIGAGSWGTALAAAACHNSDTLLWSRDADQAAHIQSQHKNPRYLSDIELPSTLQASADMEVALAHIAADPEHSLIILGVPVLAMRSTCQQWFTALQARGLQEVPIVWTCKGFEEHTGLLPHELVAQVGGQDIPHLGALSGPSFAREVVQQLPVALTVASSSARVAQTVTQILHTPFCRIYTSLDLIGVEVGGALKNVIAIACGISDGLQLGNNARAALITRGLAETARLGIALGGKAETFAGLTGLGDLVLTATGDLSRNRQVGLALGQGQSLEDILASGMTAEGVRCARDSLARANALQIEMPITQAVCAVLFEQMSPLQAVSQLLSREAKIEGLK